MQSCAVRLSEFTIGEQTVLHPACKLLWYNTVAWMAWALKRIEPIEDEL
jgi:hypothetical protein